MQYSSRGEYINYNHQTLSLNIFVLHTGGFLTLLRLMAVGLLGQPESPSDPRFGSTRDGHLNIRTRQSP